MTIEIQTYAVAELHFDPRNPRLSEFSEEDRGSDEDILKVLWETMAVDEIVLSIAASGFFPHEQLIVTREIVDGTSKLIVVEGNRRLAAVKAILNPSFVENLINSEVVQGVSGAIKQSLQQLPAIEVASREEAWKFIGFKHINGAAKWGSYAKAQYISQIHKEFDIPLKDIARQIGDNNQTVQKLYQGFRVIKQAEDRKVFNTADITGSRLFFSHLFTGLGYEGVQKYLGINKENIEFPVADDKMEDLGLFLGWLFGSKSRKRQPVIQSQNPDLRRLDAVLRNKEATILLKDGSPLAYAYEISQPRKDIFEQSLVEAKKQLQKANSYSSIAYEGGREALGMAGDIAELAEALYEFMEKKHEELLNKDNTPKKRVTTQDV
ncbi:MAG: hypothetical protein EAZ70_00135 [Runella slithyformis]|nr:MAG: hypothetical protein EAY79_00530 [Runella slithyformis]TAF29957.1 MAG: hypothetical protein EAZ70_00135 [Runella slithyformis]TAF49073.1 MAG: hypothetical protein EAZ63_02200 [Runella slithyformis]TAF83568.1 MAG: hypothetical protein EAZ50_00290 [Runella slithyformis]TAH16484.1 MAG: hypothetical protein EAZ14_00560 [Runella slithyformis]